MRTGELAKRLSSEKRKAADDNRVETECLLINLIFLRVVDDSCDSRRLMSGRGFHMACPVGSDWTSGGVTRSRRRPYRTCSRASSCIPHLAQSALYSSNLCFWPPSILVSRHDYRLTRTLEDVAPNEQC